MPEHAHLLICRCQQVYDISDILNSIKQSVAKQALLYVRQQASWFLPRMADQQPNGILHYRFWQRGGGHDRNIYEPGTAYEQMEYMHNNPVRRGLCVAAVDWYWSSAADHARIRSGPLRLGMESLPMIESHR